jgi:hypothetical protein
MHYVNLNVVSIQFHAFSNGAIYFALVRAIVEEQSYRGSSTILEIKETKVHRWKEYEILVWKLH